MEAQWMDGTVSYRRMTNNGCPIAWENCIYVHSIRRIRRRTTAWAFFEHHLAHCNLCITGPSRL